MERGDERRTGADGEGLELVAGLVGEPALPARLPTEPEGRLTEERRGLIRQLNPLGRLWLRLVARFHEYASKLVPHTLNLSWITDQLAVGGSFGKQDIPRLAALGITHVVDCRAESQDDAAALGRHGIVLQLFPIKDKHAHSQEQLDRGSQWILARLNEGARVFVHCEHGVGRGPLLALATLVRQGYPVPEALRLVRQKRWQVAPNDRQLEALLCFEQRLRQTAPSELPGRPDV